MASGIQSLNPSRSAVEMDGDLLSSKRQARSNDRERADLMLEQDLARARAIRSAALNTIGISTAGKSQDNGFHSKTSMSVRTQTTSSRTISAPSMAASRAATARAPADNMADAIAAASTSGASGALLEENRMLREKLSAKGTEVFEAKREVDRLHEQLREQQRFAANQNNVQSPCVALHGAIALPHGAASFSLVECSPCIHGLSPSFPLLLPFYCPSMKRRVG
eukprot:m.804158 g.804158  ORF g.804158 m.804158 type:complete len:223 (-) comp23368_c0_seq14:2832-3500(-)